MYAGCQFGGGDDSHPWWPRKIWSKWRMSHTLTAIVAFLKPQWRLRSSHMNAKKMSRLRSLWAPQVDQSGWKRYLIYILDMDADGIGRRRTNEDPPRVNTYARPANTSSISSEEYKDGLDNLEVCQICNDSTLATRPFLRVEGALDFLQNAECEYCGPYGCTIYGSWDVVSWVLWHSRDL